jgi:hypothetical protein
MHFGSNKYPGMRNYMIVGLYRNGEIGDPNLLYPGGRHVYGTDGAPGVVYLDGFIVGKTQASVLGEALLTDAPPPPADAGTGTTPPPGTGTGTDPGDAGTVVGNNPTDPGTAATPPPDNSGSTTAAASPNVTAAAVGGGGGCSSGGLPVIWTSLIGFSILMVKARRRCQLQAVRRD